jgi:integrase/recombinase XerD
MKTNSLQPAATKSVTAVQPTPNRRIKDLVNKFISEQDIKESSRQLYRETLTLFFEYIKQQGLQLNSLTRADIINYKEHLLSSGRSPLTTGSYITAVRKFYEYAEGELIYPNIAKGVKTPRRKQEFMKQHLTAEKSAELMEHYTNNLRNEALVNLLLRTGIRTIEAIRANIEDITFKDGRRILKVWGKGRDAKDSFVILTDKCYSYLRDYLQKERKGAKPAEPLFTSQSHQNNGERLTTRSIRGIIKQGLISIGLDGREYTAHSLRHTTAVTILKAGGSLEDAQQVLRHSSPNTTQIYTRSIEEELRIEHAPESLIDNAF